MGSLVCHLCDFSEANPAEKFDYKEIHEYGRAALNVSKVVPMKELAKFMKEKKYDASDISNLLVGIDKYFSSNNFTERDTAKFRRLAILSSFYTDEAIFGVNAQKKVPLIAILAKKISDLMYPHTDKAMGIDFAAAEIAYHSDLVHDSRLVPLFAYTARKYNDLPTPPFD